MPEIRVDELKARVVEVVADVSRNQTEYIVMDDGVPVATLVPLPASERVELREEDIERELDDWFADMDLIAAEVEQSWPDDVSVADAIAAQRR